MPLSGLPSSRPPPARSSHPFAACYRQERDRLAPAVRGKFTPEECREWAACLLLRLTFASYLHARDFPGRGVPSRRWLRATVRAVRADLPHGAGGVAIELPG